MNEKNNENNKYVVYATNDLENDLIECENKYTSEEVNTNNVMPNFHSNSLDSEEQHTDTSTTLEETTNTQIVTQTFILPEAIGNSFPTASCPVILVPTLLSIPWLIWLSKPVVSSSTIWLNWAPVALRLVTLTYSIASGSENQFTQWRHQWLIIDVINWQWSDVVQ